VITEGNSAAGTASKLFSHGGPNVRDYVGIMPIRGKGLNVMGRSILRILRNKEIRALKDMLGLQENVNYLEPENYKTLRYGGGVYFFSDADDDGKHITSIELNLFFCRYPSLLAAGYCYNIDTPYLIVSKGSNVLSFYSTESYDAWCQQTADYATWAHRYIKGLGTLNDDDIAREYSDPHFIHFFFDEETPRAMQLAFHKKASHYRKEFMAQWRSLPNIDKMRDMPVSTYIYQNWTKYSKTNVIRALPNLLSGMKRTHMKVLQACILMWKGVTPGKKLEPKKITAIAGRTLEAVAYHHGDAILGKVIIGMCQDFVGAANLALLKGDGNVGTRHENGADAAAPRYPSARPDPLFPYIIRPEDQDILEYMVDEGMEVEPIDFLPVVPLCLINGIVGIGTGHSTTTVNHHPLDCTHLLKLLLTGTSVDDLPDLLPHYVGFRGTTHVIDRNAKKRQNASTTNNPAVSWAVPTTPTVVTDVTPTATAFNFTPPALANDNNGEETTAQEDESEEDELLEMDIEIDEDDDTRQCLSLVTRGIYSMEGNRIIVTELPIGMSMLRYRQQCNNWLEQKLCTDYIDRCSHEVPYFEIHGFRGTLSYTGLCLESHIPMSNMRFLDHKGDPVRYDTSLDILYAFYCQRLPKYQLRKESMLRKIEAQIAKQAMRMKFIQLVVSGTVNIRNRPAADIAADLLPHGVDWLQCRDITVWRLTAEKIVELQQEIEVLQRKHDDLQQTSKEQLWLSDLADFEKAAGNRFGPRRTPPTTTVATAITAAPTFTFI